MLSWSDWGFLYLDQKGRINRLTFCFGAIPLLLVAGVIGTPLNLLAFALDWPTPLRSIGSIAVLLLVGWPAWCLAVKRRHDRGAGGLDIVICALLVVLQLLWRGAVIDPSTPHRKFPRPSAPDSIVDVLASLPTSSIAYLIVSVPISA